MCGIIGYIGEKEAAPILINGLKKLEYRGYDSAGLTINNNSSLSTIKKQGKIEELEKQKKPEGKIGIAHTRWATHGAPNETNAHPQSNEKRWENYLRRYMERDDAIVFITEGAVYAYNASQTAGETPLPEDTGFARVVLNVEIREKGRRREEKVANYYVVRMRDCKK